MPLFRNLADWVDSRTNFRAGRKHLLDEELPAGTGWWFVTGSILLFLLGTQLLSGVVLAMYYVPSPDFAYDSVRFIMEQLTFGSLLRGLHFFGASFIVVGAVVHMLRVVIFGAYKAPREVTWITGVLLLLIILGFALSGYLLPWDQRAYWATTVTINIARQAPFIGETIASVMRGGDDLGALTLLRWYATHVFLLPAGLIGFVVAHVYLMRHHGISGPLEPKPGRAKPFYPYHAVKDTLAVAAVCTLLFVLVVKFPPSLEAIADPTDTTFVPRPEWYFLGLFQMLKYFPGPLEPVATMVIPGLVVAGLFLLPFLDRSRSRDPRKRPLVMASFAGLGLAVTTLTVLGLRDSPPSRDLHTWTPLSLAGYEFAQDKRCQTCHTIGGSGGPLSQTALRKDPEWLIGHVVDPEMIAPGLRDAPPGGMSMPQARAVLAYMRHARATSVPPAADKETRLASTVLVRYCFNCHAIDGEGGTSGPDLTHTGREHDADWLRRWIVRPNDVKPGARMPAFGSRLDDEQLDAISRYLASRK